MIEIGKVINVINAIPGIIAMKDVNSTYICGNKQTATLMGCKHAEDVTGLTDYDIKAPASELAPMFVEQDKLVISGQEIQHLDVHYYADGLHMILFNKHQLVNEHNEVIGTVIHGTDLKADIINRFYNILAANGENEIAKKNLLTGTYIVGESEYNYGLTQRESECLFFLLRGKTAKEIANVLNISKKTVSYYIDQVKCKLNCANKSALIELCMHNGLFFSIPYRFMHHSKA